MTVLQIAKLRIDGGTQSRAALYQNVVDDYAAVIGGGAVFPPVVVFFDGDEYWLADGFQPRDRAPVRSITAIRFQA